MTKTLWYPLTALVLCAFALWTVQGVGLTLVHVKGSSMLPSYTDGQVLFVNRLAYGFQGDIIGDYFWIWKTPSVGDVVVVRSPEEGHLVVKRVAGTSGMPLRIRGHSLSVGDRVVPLTLAQEYWLAACPQVPGESLFVVGDNLDHSRDSRDWGFVPLDRVVGRPLF